MIRTATIDDLKPLARLYKEHMVFHNNIDPQYFKIPSDEECLAQIEEMLTESIYKIIVYEDDGIICGYTNYMLLNAGASERFGIMGDIFVAEQYRRQGVGTSLMNEFLKDTKKGFCKTVEIDVHVNNTSAQKFYEKMGFVPRAIQMEKRL